MKNEVKNVYVEYTPENIEKMIRMQIRDTDNPEEAAKEIYQSCKDLFAQMAVSDLQTCLFKERIDSNHRQHIINIFQAFQDGK